MPVKFKKGESPIKGNGKLLIIDGGFSKAYQKTTGIAGYTLIYSSHYLHLKAHTPFTTIKDAIANNSDIADLQVISVEDFKQRKMVIDTDLGQRIKELISDLEDLLEMYKQGLLRERLTDEKGNPFI